MLYPNVYPENKRRIRATNNNSSLSLKSSIINLEKEVSRLNQEIVELKLALAQIIDVLSNFSVNANGKKLPGLVKRREEERKLFLS